jgi:hypothetical protein
MDKEIGQNDANRRDEVQLELLEPWYARESNESRTLDLFDAIPKYPFPTTTTSTKAERIQAPFSLRGKQYLAEILPAQIKHAKTGRERLVFPGSREELVERALRFIAVQQIAETKLTADLQTGRQAVTVFFSLSMLRRHLEELGHGFKLNEIKEALDILSGTMIELSRAEEDQREPKNEHSANRRRNFIKATILSNYAGAFEHGDSSGEKSLAAMTFHPLASQAILGLAYFPINHTRVSSLKRPLSRWLTTRMSHNYRQARKSGYVYNEGYHIALKTILEERGLPRQSRLRDNVDSVREALAEMKQRQILAEIQPYEEKLTHAITKGRPKIVEAVWKLYPSGKFVDEVINGNRGMTSARIKVGGNSRESRLLPDFNHALPWGK